jgi:uncharacterized protein YegJ (DUF2314 family)
MSRFLTLLMLCVLCSCSPDTSSQNDTKAEAQTEASAEAAAKPIDENAVVSIANDDPAMNAAMAKAQATLDEFLAVNAAPPKGTEGYKLKVKITDENGSEHFWVEPFAQTKHGFEGTLANRPEVVTSVKEGQKITFERKDISDWGYVKDGHQIGGFTVCVMFKEMPANEVEYYRSNYGYDC